jgi:hypothetical protein
MIKSFLKLRKRVIQYFSHHVEYNAAVHTLGGIGLGILLASPIADPHPVRWGIALLLISLAGHFYALTVKR